MIMRILSFMGDLYGQIGPGLILAALLPFTLMAFAMTVGEITRRVRLARREVASG